ncbi:aminoacyl-histidine dipeptidase [Klebsiella pneumoniae]|uniref:Aminoacyl-histidine dipeptidase n=1 Tax=Klebsiella pneumoniae TaxID=573 RepID=A0A3S4KIG9_KLEPN|nr:aminoacyl-histidine dipeptidase [Klebsiella pneumoniae]
MGWAKEKGLHAERDQVGNILIRKGATAGMENRKPVALQAHLDMVPQKNNDTVHDFVKDPIQPYIDGEWVKARGTTLARTTVSEWRPHWRYWPMIASLTARWKCC